MSHIKTPLITIATIAVCATVYGMFKPLFHGPFGWQVLPAPQPEIGEQKLFDSQWQEPAKKAHDLLVGGQQQIRAPAISVAVGINGKLIWAGAIGYADLATHQAVTLQSRFRLGSTSKAVTSVAVGTLLQQGKLDLDAPIQRYVPDYPKKEQRLTTRQVMSHMAGIRNYQLCWCFPVWETLNTSHYTNLRDSLKPVEGDALEFAPGSQFAYTSHGFNITGAVIEGASGQDFLSYLDAAVVTPLGLQHTGAENTDQNPTSSAQFYEVQAGNYKLAFPVDNSNKWPSGGLLSTPSDMVTLGNALLTNRLLAPEIKAQLFTPQHLSNGQINEQNYALGWRHKSDWKLLDGSVVTPAVHHGGLATGSSSWFVLYPEFNLSLSIMMNRNIDQISPLIKLGDAIASEFVKVAAVPNGIATSTPLPTAQTRGNTLR